MLALVAALASLSSLLVPAQVPTPPTVAGQLQCPSDQWVVTVDNPGDLTYQVDVDVFPDGGSSPPTTSATVGPGAVVEIPISLGGIPDPMNIVVTGDNGFPETSFPVVFHCAERVDFAVTTPESTPVVIDLPGPCDATTEAEHGTLEKTRLLGQIRYTPDPGFVGEDGFDYDCVVSATTFGTVSITVTPASAPPSTAAAPAAAEPTFTG